MGPPLAILAILLLLLSSASSAQQTPTCLKRDRDALLAFKAGLYDPGNQLASWTSSGNCCTFLGITCNAQGEVANFTYAAFAETDCEEDCNRIQSKFRGTNSANLIGTTLNKLLSLEVLNLTNFFLQDVTPSGLSVLKKLRVLWLSRTLLHGPISADIGKITSLEYFTLNNNNYDVTGPLPASFCNLVNLRGLNLTESRKALKSGALPSCIGQWKQLQYLEVDFNSFSGRIPASLKQLKNLNSLKLARNNLSGSLPLINSGELPALEELHLQGNDFVGSIPPSFGNLVALKDLRVGGIQEFFDFGVLIKSKLAGSLPSTLGNLVKLETLVIRGTSITVAIPQSVGNLPVISDLRLDNNQFTGPIPTNLGKTGNLINLEINDNKLSGPIPSTLGGAGKKLKNFVASRNELSGTIPDSLGLLKLSILDLSFNKLTTISANVGFGVSRVLDLSHNQLTGALNPPSLWGIDQVYLNHNLLTSLGSTNVQRTTNLPRKFLVNSNQLAGPIPPWVFQSTVDTLDLSDNKLTKLPTIQGSNIRFDFYINLSSNAITGTIPIAFAQECCISILDLSRNLFSGIIPSVLIAPSLISVLNLGENQLTGPVPSNLYGSSKQALILNKNRLSGSIPERRPEDIATIRYLDLSDNQLTGPIPASIFAFGNFAGAIKLSNNRLTGPVPDFSSLCDSGLDGLFLANNLLTGPILPLGTIFSDRCGQNLQALDVSGNKLSGSIPASIATLKSLRVLDVSKNAIIGPIPASLNALAALQILDVSNNKLTGALPIQQLVSGFPALKVAGQASDYSPGAPLFTYLPEFPADRMSFSVLNLVLTTTTALNVSVNGLTGAIDPSVGDLKGLHLLDFSHNKFTGPVPASIAQITDLDDLDVSFNQLSGPIPSQLKGFPAEDFVGNPSLCGPPLAKNC